jgi:hypothetical protein
MIAQSLLATGESPLRKEKERYGCGVKSEWEGEEKRGCQAQKHKTITAAAAAAEQSRVTGKDSCFVSKGSATSR